MGRQYAQIPFSHLLIDIEKLYPKISSLLHQTQVPILYTSCLKALNLHWNIGKLIVEVEDGENISDGDHHKLLSQLSKHLTKKLGEQLDFSTLEDSCKFYLIYSLFPKIRTLSKVAEIPEFQAPLTWEHYCLLIMYVSCPKTRNFYEKKAAIVVDPHPCLSSLLEVTYLKDFPAVQIRKVFCDLRNKEIWRCFQQILMIFLRLCMNKKQ